MIAALTVTERWPWQKKNTHIFSFFYIPSMVAHKYQPSLMEVVEMQLADGRMNGLEIKS